MGWLARAIDAGGEFRNPLDDIEDGLFLTTGRDAPRRPSSGCCWCSPSMIAAGGVVGDSTPAVIGAMIVAPLATPIYGVALATVTGSRRDLCASLLLLVEGVAVNILIGVLIGAVHRRPHAHGRQPADHRPHGADACSTWASRSPSAWPARSPWCAATSPTSSPAWPSPSRWCRCSQWSASRSGRGAWTWRGAPSSSSSPTRRRSSWPAWSCSRRRATSGWPRSAAGTRDGAPRYSSPSSWSRSSSRSSAGVHGGPTLRAVDRRHRRRRCAWVKGTDWKVEYVKQEGSDIVITAVGPGDPPPIEGLRQAVRRNVPRHIDVRVVEDSGNTTEL